MRVRGRWWVQHPKVLPASGCLGGLRAGGEGTAGWEVTPNPAAPQPCLPAPPHPCSSPLCVPSITVGQSQSRGLALGGSSRALGSIPTLGPASKGYGTPPLSPSNPCSPAGHAMPAGAGRLLTPHTGLSLCAWGILSTFFHFSPLPQLTPCKREQRWPRGLTAGLWQGDTAGDTRCCPPTPGAAPAPDSSSTSLARGYSPQCVFWGGGLKLRAHS